MTGNIEIGDRITWGSMYQNFTITSIYEVEEIWYIRFKESPYPYRIDYLVEKKAQMVE